MKAVFASETERKEMIAAAAKVNAEYIMRELLTNDALAIKVCDEIPGNMDTLTIVQLVRLSMIGDLDSLQKVRELILQAAAAAAEREAEGEAIEEFDPPRVWMD